LAFSIANAFVRGAANNGAPWARAVLPKAPSPMTAATQLAQRQYSQVPRANRTRGIMTGGGLSAAARPRAQTIATGLANQFHPGAAATGTPTAPAPQPAPQPSPLDSTYFGNVAANEFKVNNEVNALNQQGAYARNDLQTALQKLAYQQPRDALKLEQGANSRGALYSTGYNQQLGDLENKYGNQQETLNQNYTRAEAAREAKIEGLQGSIPLYQVQQYNDAVGRAALLAQNDKALGEPIPAAPAAAVAKPAARPVAPAKVAAPKPGAITPASRKLAAQVTNPYWGQVRNAALHNVPWAKALLAHYPTKR